MQNPASDWNSSLIPPTIRRPWRVFEEDVEDRVNESLAEGTEVDGDARQQLSACQARGARAAFMDLSVDQQQAYAEVSLMELSAYVSWRRHLVSQASDAQEIPGEFELKWDGLDCDAKADWVPEDPRAALASDAAWLPLLADGPPSCGPLQAVGAPATKLEQNGSGEEAVAAPPLTKLEKASAAAAAEAAKPAQTVEDDAGDDEPAPAAPSSSAGKDAAEPTAAPAAGGQKQPAEEAATADGDGKGAAADGSAAAQGEAPMPLAAGTAADAKAQSAANAEPDKQAAAGSGKKKAGSGSVPGALGKLLAKQAAQATSSTGTGGKAPATPKARKPSTGAAADTAGKADAAKDAANGNIATRLRSASSRGPAIATAPSAPVAPAAAPQPRSGRLKRLAGAAAAPFVAVPVSDSAAPRAGLLAPENLCPEALDAECIICGSSETCIGNDIGLCDRCDRAFHQQCHDPAVPYFGRPDDQWFCSACCEELAKVRKLRFRAGDFVWAMFPPDPVPWPARVYRIDFASMNDPKPYWIQYYDAGAKTGAWLGDSQVTAWADGPGFGTLRDSRRRLAVRLAEAEGASPISTDAVQQAPVAPLPKMEAKIPRVGAAATPLSGRARASSAVAGSSSQQPRHKRRRRAGAAGSDGEPDEDLASQVEAIRSMVAEARERQFRLEKELDDAAAGVGLQGDGDEMVD